jgi:hypothetical protein
VRGVPASEMRCKRLMDFIMCTVFQ